MPHTDNEPVTDHTAAARAALTQAHHATITAENTLIAAVAAARAAGATWDEIGADTGMAGPNAHRKFRPYLEETSDRTVTVRPIVKGKPCPECGARVDDVQSKSAAGTRVWTAAPCGHTRNRSA